MGAKQLQNKPLVEALVELNWASFNQQTRLQTTYPDYQLLLGRFSERIEHQYPYHESLPASQIPDEMAALLVQHRFRIAENSWPLLQIGPGILTVNETDGYTWPTFQDRCNKAIECLFEAHPGNALLMLQGLKLHYIDAIDNDFRSESIFTFLRDKMKTEIRLPSQLFDDKNVSNIPATFNWQASFPNLSPGGLITLRFSTGQRNGQQALIWETIVETSGNATPQTPEGCAEWIVKAHDLADEWFFIMIEGELHRRFSGE